MLASALSHGLSESPTISVVITGARIPVIIPRINVSAIFVADIAAKPFTQVPTAVNLVAPCATLPR